MRSVVVVPDKIDGSHENMKVTVRRRELTRPIQISKPERDFPYRSEGRNPISPPSGQEVTRIAKSGDRPEHCPICQRYVPSLRRHANALHLPWYVDPSTACRRCELQLITKGQLERHVAICHPTDSGKLLAEWWIVQMNACFRKLTTPLGVKGFGNITDYVRRNHLGLSRRPCLRADEEDYFNESWCGKTGPFQPENPRDLRDCCHWKVILRLIQRAGSDLFRDQIQPANDYDGRVFLIRQHDMSHEAVREVARLQEQVRHLQHQCKK